jgi:phosphoribosylanthranilate isomerase
MPKRKIKVKICGLTNWADARCACQAGADFLGFNFYPRSPRYVDPAKARAIVARLPEKVASVGIFVNEPEADLVRVAKMVGLSCVQLHGDETPAAVSRLRRLLPAVKIIKAIRVRQTLRAAQIKRFQHASALLLDGFDGRRRGGTGKTFDWSLARLAAGRAQIFLAGGIAPENVAKAIRAGRPYAVDVCSGVEMSPGKKDRARIKALMHAVHGWRSGKRK